MDFFYCPECGCQINENTTECPLCGCPINSTSVDEELLNEGKSTEAESTIRDYANTILKWGNYLAIFNFIMTVIYGVGSCGLYLMTNYFGYTELFICSIVVVVCIILGFLSYIITKFIAKLIWASIMLFVNISTTLKRIEIKLEEHGTH